MRQAEELMKEGVAIGVFPGGVLCVWVKGAVRFCKAYGVTDLESRHPVTTDTVFDLASLTKPLATAPAILKLADQGFLSVEDPAGKYLDGFDAGDKKEITIAHLLCHTSGLPAHREYFYDLSTTAFEDRQPALKKLLENEPLEYRPGEKVVYSDLGYMVLGFIVKAVSGLALDRFATDRLYRPLAIFDLFFIPINPETAVNNPLGLSNVAATENCPRRKMVVRGVVHDDNAYEMGGVAGQAGLFGTAGAVTAFAAEILDVYSGAKPGPVFSSAMAAHMMAPQCGTNRTFGFDTVDPENSSAGRLFSARGAGHLGFTGTSCWIDPDREAVVVLLTNRVHPDRASDAIRAFRPRLHDAVMVHV
ncbi:serine hydrolase domain-containing protein [Desulfosudis oleivorans]|uniref:Beta-lactamase n=1 Tax=Desulfosudis oleivorans (strain DSM 6200 / JCM 39069 / Hxd3) TaxID=96561 RepID=A8ZU89_DESOH|nr:serine hydrolase domain-containing protein [Desulfosudis oleivorans]ABW66401.1 beta-lactamase [Desulfosudis oleivorans Hxd3]